MGRHSEYTDALGDEICAWIADGGSLLQWCKAKGESYGTIMRYLSSNEQFRDNYARAREDQAHKLAEEILQIADTPQLGVKTKTNKDGEVETTVGDMIEHRRLQVDARKWYAGKVAPKKYGDFQRTELSGADGKDMRFQVVAPWLTANIAKRNESD